jgi:drug/metabolite transporter (DMT)-like permease
MAANSGSPAGLAVYFKLTVVALAFGGTFVAGRVAMQEALPLPLATWRYVIGTAALLPLLLIREGRLALPSGRTLAAVFVMGLFAVFAYNLLFFEGLGRIHAGRAALIVGFQPALVVLAARVLFGEAFTVARIAGSGLAILGAGVVATRGEPGQLLTGAVGLGEILMFGAAASFAAATLAGRYAVKEISPLAAATWQCLVGTVLLLAVGAFDATVHAPFSVNLWLLLGFMGIIGVTLTFTWYFEGVSVVGPARAAMFMNLIPVFGVGLAHILLGEPIDASIGVGGALVCLGVWLLNRSGRPAPQVPLSFSRR